MKDLIYKESARRIIDSPRSKRQMLKILESLPPANPGLTDEEWRQIKQLRSYHNGSYAQLLDKLIAAAQPDKCDRCRFTFFEKGEEDDGD